MNIYHRVDIEYEALIGHAGRLRDARKANETIAECVAAVERAMSNVSHKKEMHARNMLASLYWSKEKVE